MTQQHAPVIVHTRRIQLTGTVHYGICSPDTSCVHKNVLMMLIVSLSTDMTPSCPTDVQMVDTEGKNEDVAEEAEVTTPEPIHLDSPGSNSPTQHDTPTEDVNASATEEDEVHVIPNQDRQHSDSPEQHTSGRRRRLCCDGQDLLDEAATSQFLGLETSMLKYQCLQHRQLKLVNRNIEKMQQGQNMFHLSFQNQMDTMNQHLACLTTAIQDLCQQVAMDSRQQRHRERSANARMDRQTRAIGRLATATTCRSRCALALHVDMGHFCGDVARGLGQITAAVDLLHSTQADRGSSDTPFDSEESQSSVSSTDARTMRRGSTCNPVGNVLVARGAHRGHFAIP